MQTKTAVFGLLLLANGIWIANASAQYVWVNEKGVKQFSDLPPPKNVPKDKILKAPGVRARAAEETGNTQANGEQGKSEIDKLQKPNSLAAKNEEFNKRKTAREEAEKKAESDLQAKQDKDKNCGRAKAYQQSIESGAPIASRDQNGERIILDESQRARELADAKKILNDCK